MLMSNDAQHLLETVSVHSPLVVLDVAKSLATQNCNFMFEKFVSLRNIDATRRQVCTMMMTLLRAAGVKCTAITQSWGQYIGY